MLHEKVKFALIGCGAIAHKHVMAIKRFNNAEVIGAFDIDVKSAKLFEEKYQIPVFTNVDELIKKTNPDVLNILTPSGLHGENILELIHFNKHFIVEKPLALRLDQIDRILEECDKRGSKIFVVKQNRFNPPVQKLKEAIDRGRFGKLVLGTIRVRWSRDQLYYNQKSWRGTWAFDGGVLTNQASHHIDMLVWMMGDVESVMAKTATRLVKIEAEDLGIAILKFRNEALGVIEATTATRPKDLEGSISILGEKGSVEIGGFFMNELKSWNFSEPAEMDKDIWSKFSKVPGESAWNHSEFFKDVIISIHNGKKGLIDGLEGRKSVELINAIYESAETGKEVFLRFVPKECRLGVTSEGKR
ncbi:MAG: Myo-inositol 2-dehydrogenase [Candidatus Jettenia ecosi]|uniref:Myo-inositol 2-dehydrogenase n=1 Tax=Candidatus Jettenia ecosi TaxID=2494326 RepID=A0A533QE30_9BACT|nr:MAG: Myo-inositol 2-dehydrogenase [Candidatus Jettenia ecosi]